MRASKTAVGFYLLTIAEVSLAYPRMQNTIREIQQRGNEIELERRATGDVNNDHSGDPMLVGDLNNGQRLTPVGATVARILLKQEDGESSEGGYKRPGPAGSKQCNADTCCIWSHISDFLNTVFKGPTGRCNKNARAAVRLGLHDAGTWSQSLADNGQDFGGADGSIALSTEEEFRGENSGLADIIHLTRTWKQKYGVGMADLIQFMAIHAVVSESPSCTLTNLRTIH